MKGKLLIVNDHKQVLKALIQLLEPEFESVTGISNPNQILSYINKEEFDVIRRYFCAIFYNQKKWFRDRIKSVEANNAKSLRHNFSELFS